MKIQDRAYIFAVKNLLCLTTSQLVGYISIGWEKSQISIGSTGGTETGVQHTVLRSFSHYGGFGTTNS